MLNLIVLFEGHHCVTGKSVVCNLMCRLKLTLFALVYGATVGQFLHALLSVYFCCTCCFRCHFKVGLF